MAESDGDGREGMHRPLSSLSQLERHTARGSRTIRENLHSVFEELLPLVQSRSDASSNSRITLSNWIQSRQQTLTPTVPRTGVDSDSYVINLDLDGGVTSPSDPVDTHTVPSTDEFGYNLPDPAGQQPSNNAETSSNTSHDESVLNLFNQSPRASSVLNIVKKYLPFVTIILAKTVYDYSPAILLFIGLYGTFGYYNTRLKAEIALQSQRNVAFLIFAVVHLLITISFFYYLYDDMKLYMSLVFIPPYVQPLTVADLLWLVAVTDFILKMITIIIKICITIIPHNLFEAKMRGKWYLAIECSSQLYRSLVPIQPWLYYLLESYQGPQKVVGVFLSAAYMVSKGADLMSRARAWWSSILKLLKDVQLGVKPDKEQLSNAGLTCPICHDDYNTPVLLTCCHVFCENCIARWFDREQTCPLCRAKVVDDPLWRDGSTSHFAQLF